MHHKFHNFGPAPPGPTNPPGLVRIQPKPSNHVGGMAANNHGGNFPRMPQLTQGRSSDVSSSVSSSTHPLGDSRSAAKVF